MTVYKHTYDFYRNTPALIKSGATLRSLFDALMSVKSEDDHRVDASPAKLRHHAQRWSQAPHFVPIRLHELFGGLVVDHTDDYILTLVGGLGGRHLQEVRLFLLRNDHLLREELFWRIFEVEGGGEISLANVDKFSREDLNWHNTVVLLTKEGTLDRKRMLRSCLQALNRDFSSYRAGWFSRVYSALEPLPQEAAADQDLLRLCMASSTTATLSLGVKQLEAVHKAGLLDAVPFVESCNAAFSGPKASAISLVRTLEALGVKAQVNADDIANALLAGLAHPHADVQRSVVKLFTKLGKQELAREQRESLAPAVAAELFPGAMPKTQLQSEAQMDAQRVSASLPSPQPLSPWTDEDAYARYATLLESPADVAEFELSLAWLATSERIAETLSPLTKRAQTQAKREIENYPAKLLLSAVSKDVEFLPRTYWQPSEYVDGKWVEDPAKREARELKEEFCAFPSLIFRMREVVTIVREIEPRRSLLATPTDTQGWVDLNVLKERFTEAKHASVSPLSHDLAQALARVRPDQRADAAAITGSVLPKIAQRIPLAWVDVDSKELNADGSPKWVHKVLQIQCDQALSLSPANPVLKVFSDVFTGFGGTDDLMTAEIAWANPASTALLSAIGMEYMEKAAGDDVEHRALPFLRALAVHLGAWTSETAQLLALGMGAKQSDQRALAVELFAAGIPGRLDTELAAEGFGRCAELVVATRWAAAFADAATLAPHTVIDLLTSLLPRLDPKMRGVGSIMNVLLDESLRQSRPVTYAALRDWLARFTGSSAAAKFAKALLTLGETRESKESDL